jgi:hypothetical protein
MKGTRKLMKTSVSEGKVSMLTVPKAGREMKIGAAQARSTEKRGFGTAKWLANPDGRKIITKTAKNSSFTP